MKANAIAVSWCFGNGFVLALPYGLCPALAKTPLQIGSDNLWLIRLNTLRSIEYIFLTYAVSHLWRKGRDSMDKALKVISVRPRRLQIWSGALYRTDRSPGSVRQLPSWPGSNLTFRLWLALDCMSSFGIPLPQPRRLGLSPAMTGVPLIGSGRRTQSTS